MANTRTKVEFDQESAAHFEFANGHRPKGYGCWSFGLGRNGAWTEFRFQGTYVDGKKAAIRETRGIGCDTVVVNS
jgi:hypothetical protein